MLVRPDMEATRHDTQIEPFLLGHRFKIDPHPVKQFVDWESGQLGFHRPGIKPCNVKQSAQNVFDRFQRAINIACHHSTFGDMRIIVFLGHALETIDQSRRI